MPNLKWQSSTLKEGVFQDNLINSFKGNSDYTVVKGTYRSTDDAKKKDGELKIKTNKGDYYITLEFKRDKTLDHLCNLAQVIHYEYQASDAGNDPLMENYGGIIISQSTIILVEYNQIPELITELYEVFPKCNVTAASKIYAESKEIQEIMLKYEDFIRKNSKFYHMDQYSYYKDVFDDIVVNLKNKINN